MNLPGGPSTSSASAEIAGRIARLMFYALLSITLMALDYRGRYVEQVRNLATQAAEPMVLLIEAPFGLGRRVAEEARSRQELLNQLAHIERELAQQRARLMLLAELDSENRELRQLLDASARQDLSFSPAELMSIDLNPYSHRVLINRGRRDGLKPGQPVIDAGGIIGQVDRVFLNTAQVILLSDPDHALPVRVDRTDLRTIAYGTGYIDRIELNDLSMNVDLRAGDLLITSGLGGGFPAGLPVAEITSVSRQAGEPFARASARPMGRLDRSRHVLVVFFADDEDTIEDFDGDHVPEETSPETPAEPEAPEVTPPDDEPQPELQP